MKEFELKYGCNPNQTPARVYMADGSELPFEILNGRPGYINLLDAFNSWQLVSELSAATKLPAAASFKHVSPAGAAVYQPLSDTLKQIYFTGEQLLSPMATAYARARGADRLCSYGDWAALSDICDEDTARLLSVEVSDGVIAPGYTEAALEILRKKRKGSYGVIQIARDYVPQSLETREVFGVTFAQGRNDFTVTKQVFSNIVTEGKMLTPAAILDLTVALITLKYTQSNSVCYAKDGQAIGVGAGQQSRVHCTRLAGGKADHWHLRQHEKVRSLPWREDVHRAMRDNAIDLYVTGGYETLTGDGRWQQVFYEKPEEFSAEERAQFLSGLSGVSLASDAFFPFDDNIVRAAESGVSFIAQPGGSVRDDLVIAEANRRNMTMVFTGMRLFHH